MSASLHNVEIKKGSNEHVSKYIFSSDEAVAEAVLYEYGGYYERTVICCSTQCGCPVGCTFCGTGKHFRCNLTTDDIVWQVMTILDDICVDASKIKKFQIMFMSMGEPFLNYNNVSNAIKALAYIYPNAQLLVSTIAPKPQNSKGIVDKSDTVDVSKLQGIADDVYEKQLEMVIKTPQASQHLKVYENFLAVSVMYSKVGLQFSIHRSTNEARNELIPFKQKMTLEEIADYGHTWYRRTGRNPYLNYCIDGTNSTTEDAQRLMKLFPPEVFCFTFSVVCSADETMKEAGYRNLEEIRKFEQLFLEKGYNTRIFDPAGQDDIGGGCGQLWKTQNWFKEHPITCKK